MSLAVGTRLGPYEITSPIGAGGMGEVYKAHDTRLKRDVALKILPTELALDAERLARFDREAQALAALNDAHIAQVYGFVHEGDIRAIVMELVGGQTLAEHIERGSVALDQALPIAIQLAGALEYAHERGIVHRDLKPANIKLTPDGDVKVLDFGLVKVLTDEAAGSAADLLDNSPTMTSPAMPFDFRSGHPEQRRGVSRVGVILGTAAYMSPEQARGVVVDKRADIWAFGAVLFEMLTGRPCFAGETVTDILAAVVKSEPDWSSLPADVPLRLRDLLRRCLSKDRRQRLQAIGDGRIELEEIAAAPSAAAGTPGPGGTTRSKSASLAWTLASTAALGLAALVVAIITGVWPRTQPADHPVIRFHISPPAGIRIPSGAYVATISPDARNVAFVGEAGRTSALWIRPIDGRDADAWRVPDSEGAVAAPFWRPDGGAIAFAVPGSLRAVDIASRIPRLVCPLPLATDPTVHGAWSPAGNIVFGPFGSGMLFEVSAAGGTPRLITRGSPRHDAEGWMQPQFLGDGRLFAMVFPETGRIDLAVGDADNPAGAVRTASPVKGPVILASGYLVYGRENVLVAQRFDASAVRTENDVSIITPGVQYQHVFGWLLPAFSVSQNGGLVYRDGSLNVKQFSIVDRRGTAIGRVGEPAEYSTFAISNDGRTIVAGRAEPDKTGIWKIDTATGNVSLISPSDEFVGDPTLGLSGFVTFGENRFERRIWQVPLDGGSRTQLLAGKVLHDRSRDGRWLLVGDGDSLRAHDVQDPGRSVDLARDGRAVDEARFSPNGRTVAYNSSESGQFEVYIVRMPPTGEKLKLSIGGGVQPKWRGDGRELYYLALDGMLMAQDISCPPDAACTPGTPHALFRTGIASPSRAIEDYDVIGSGDRFAILSSSSEAGPLTVLLNWPELLKKK